MTSTTQIKGIQGTVVKTLNVLKSLGVTFKRNEYNGQTEYQFRYVPSRELNDLMQRFARAYKMTPTLTFNKAIVEQYGHVMLVITAEKVDEQLKRAQQRALRMSENGQQVHKFQLPTFHQLVTTAPNVLPSKKDDPARLENMKEYLLQQMADEKHESSSQPEDERQNESVDYQNTKTADKIYQSNMTEQEAIETMNQDYLATYTTNKVSVEKETQEPQYLAPPIPMEGLENYKVIELKHFCHRLGLKVSGKKADLISRIQEYNANDK